MQAYSSPVPRIGLAMLLAALALAILASPTLQSVEGQQVPEVGENIVLVVGSQELADALSESIQASIHTSSCLPSSLEDYTLVIIADPEPVVCREEVKTDIAPTATADPLDVIDEQTRYTHVILPPSLAERYLENHPEATPEPLPDAGVQALAVQQGGHYIVLLSQNIDPQQIQHIAEYLVSGTPPVSQQKGWILPPSTTLVAVLAAAATAGLAMAYRASPRFRESLWRRLEKILKLLPYLLVFYPRITGDRVLQHPLRKMILDHLRENLYATVKTLSSKLHVSRATILWHLGLLEREGHIGSADAAGTILYYIRGTRKKALTAYLAVNPIRRRILEALEEAPTTLNKLSALLDVSKSTVKHHLDILVHHGIVSRTEHGYTLSPEEEKRRLRMAGRP